MKVRFQIKSCYKLYQIYIMSIQKHTTPNDENEDMLTKMLFK